MIEHNEFGPLTHAIFICEKNGPKYPKSNIRKLTDVIAEIIADHLLFTDDSTILVNFYTREGELVQEAYQSRKYHKSS
jgi:hypothetical protein